MAGLRGERELRDMLSRKLSRGFAEHVAGARSDWPQILALGRPSRREILDGFGDIATLVRTLRSWEQDEGVVVTYQMREAGGLQRLPTHVTIPSIDVAARLASPRSGERWVHILARTRARALVLQERCEGLDAASIARVLRAEDGEDDLEFEMVVRAGEWFATHDACGLSSREVPLPGIDGKWLGNARRRSLVCLMAGKDDLGLVRMPARLDFAYLDPTHLEGGGRRYDSWVSSDIQRLAYAPRVVIIVENRETYLKFPQVDGGVCIFGSGKAGVALVGELDWISSAARLCYWGDLDADGFEILNAYRAAGVACESILMDMPTLQCFGRYGTNLEKDHKNVIHRERKDLVHLTPEEQEVYELLTSDAYTGNRRLEQERIPLVEALAACGSPRESGDT